MLDNYKGQREYYRFGDLHSYEQNPLCIRTCVAKNTQATQIYLGNRSYGIQSRGRIEEAKSRTQRYPPIQRPCKHQVTGTQRGSQHNMSHRQLGFHSGNPDYQLRMQPSAFHLIDPQCAVEKDGFSNRTK